MQTAHLTLCLSLTSRTSWRGAKAPWGTYHALAESSQSLGADIVPILQRRKWGSREFKKVPGKRLREELN